MTNENLRKFRVLYNQLDELLSKKAKEYHKTSFILKLKKFVKKYPSFRPLKNDIRLVHDLRNLLIHEEKESSDIAIPTNEYLEKIIALIDAIERPQTAIDIASTEIFACDPNDKILNITKTMSDRVYTQVPVFEDKRNLKGFIGVFSTACLANILATDGVEKTNGILIQNKSAISNVIELIKKPLSESWEFVSTAHDVSKIKRIFNNEKLSPDQTVSSRVGVIFLTDTGNPNEQMRGILTPWDMSKIKAVKI